MTTDADQLRRDIELTQRGLSDDVNALAEKVRPRRILQRRMDRTRRAVTSMKDKIMGTAAEGTTSVGDRMSSAASAVADTASSAAQTVAETPQAVRRGAEGNPLAAGLIAFGLGWLTASLLPPSRREQQLAEQAKDLAQQHAQPMVSEAAEQVKESLREPAQQAVESVKATAADAQSTVADETRAAAEDLTEQAKDAKDKVRQTGQSS